MTQEVRCRQCGARLRADARWCTLCYTPTAEQPLVVAQVAGAAGASSALPPAPPLSATPAADASGEPASSEPTSTPASLDHKTPCWPCRGCGAAVPLDADACPACATPFLIDTDADTRATLARLTSTRSKTLIMIVGSLGLGVIFVAGMYLLAAIF